METQAQKKETVVNRFPTTWQEAATFMNIDPGILPGVDGLPERARDFIVGMYQRMIIVEALNKASGLKDEERWVPDWNDFNQAKYYPWGQPGKDDQIPSGFRLSRADYVFTDSDSAVGSRLSLRNSKLCLHMWKYFRQVLVDTMLIPKGEKT